MSNLHIKALPPREQSLTGQVFDRISEMLLDCMLKPDSRTSIRELADELGVSTMPVREAVGRLVAQGALVIRRNRAIEVPRMTADEFRELTHTRILLESEAARLAVDRMTQATAADLAALQDEFAVAVAQERYGDALALNRRLHFTLYDQAGTHTMRQLIGMTWLKVGPLLSLDLNARHWELRRSGSVQIHARLIDAVERRDRDAAADAIRDDIMTAAEKILSLTQFFGRHDGPEAQPAD